jgi:hypothetical protein
VSDRNFAAALELEPDLVARTAFLYEGYARLILDDDSRPDDERRMLGASCLTIAASHRALVVPDESRPLYAAAAEAYYDLERPYFATLSVCGRHLPLIATALDGAMTRDRDERRGLLDPEVLLHDSMAMMGAIAMLPDGAAVLDPLSRLLQRTRANAYDPLGRLGIPAHVYFSLANAMRLGAVQDDPGADRLRSVLADYLRRVDDAVGAAMRDRYHWSRLRSGILPVEPEVVAACVTAAMLSRRWHDMSLGAMLDNANLSPRQMATAHIASRLAEAPPFDRRHSQGAV